MIRTESAQPIDIGAYRDVIAPLDLGDVTITEVFDPNFDDDQNVALIRIQAVRTASTLSCWGASSRT